MSASRFSRRNLLRGSLATTALLPFLDSEHARGAAAVPRRLLVIHTPNGTQNKLFWPDASLTLPRLSAPLEEIKSKLTFLKGIALNNALQNGALGGNVGSEHARGTGGMLTGRPLNSGTEFMSFGNTTSGWGSGISIDQYLATKLNLKSIQVGVQVADSQVRARISYTGSNQPLPPQDNPSLLFENLFSGLTSGGTASAPDAASERLRAQRKSVFDLTGTELTRVRGLVGGADRDKIDAHLQGMRAIEKELTELQTNAPAPGMGCMSPAAVTLSEADRKDETKYEQVSRVQMDLTAAALACNVAQIATFQFSYSESEHLFSFLKVTGNHHGLSHDFNALEPYNQIQEWYAKQVAYFLKKLDSYAEGDGTLLDNTLVLWATEIGEASQHDLKLMPYVFAGSAGGQFKTGRVLDLGSGKVDNNQMLVSIANLMGDASLTEFGDASGKKGALPGLL